MVYIGIGEAFLEFKGQELPFFLNFLPYNHNKNKFLRPYPLIPY